MNMNTNNKETSGNLNRIESLFVPFSFHFSPCILFSQHHSYTSNPTPSWISGGVLARRGQGYLSVQNLVTSPPPPMKMIRSPRHIYVDVVGAITNIICQSLFLGNVRLVYLRCIYNIHPRYCLSLSIKLYFSIHYLSLLFQTSPGAKHKVIWVITFLEIWIEGIKFHPDQPIPSTCLAIKLKKKYGRY